MDGKISKLDDKTVEIIKEKSLSLAETGMQVIALSEKLGSKENIVDSSNYENDMTFIGFVGFLDPPKKM